MEIYPGADIIECEIGGRPLYLPLLREGRAALLLDCGTRDHAVKDVPAYLDQLGVGAEDLIWLIMTHPDGDHCGGAAKIKQRYPNVRLVCGGADRDMIESPDHLFSLRYDTYRQDHDIYFDSKAAEEIRNCSSGHQEVTLTFVGGEILRLGPNRILEIWHLPGHSQGHLGIYDCNHRVLYFGDAVQGAGYRSVHGGWSLCPTYIDVNAYLQTIHAIENSDAQMIVGCHWPVMRGKSAIGQFCLESKNFVARADKLVSDYLRTHASGVTLRELCEQLSDQLGDWPREVRFELANALSGHLNRGIRSGRLEMDRSAYPVTYRSSGSCKG